MAQHCEIYSIEGKDNNRSLVIATGASLRRPSGAWAGAVRPGAHGAPGSSPGTRHPHGDSVRAWRSHEIACVKCLAERWHLVRLDKWEVLCCHRGKVCFEQRPVKWRSEADFRAAMPDGGNALSFRPRAGSGYSRPISNAAQSTEPLKFKVDLWPGPPPLPTPPPHRPPCSGSAQSH